MISAFQPGEKPPGSRPQASTPSDVGLARVLRCSACLAVVTSDEARISVGGSHSHRFTNPAGITYDLVCFAAAEGCYVDGQPTTEFTWFAGFAWSYAMCSTCHRHLGWYYEGPSKFFGLISSQLTAP